MLSPRGNVIRLLRHAVQSPLWVNRVRSVRSHERAQFRSCPKADKTFVDLVLTLCAKLRRRMASFDHLIGGGEQRLRHGEVERLRGLEIDQKLELGPPAFRFMRPVADVARVEPRAPRCDSSCTRSSDTCSAEPSMD